MDQEQQAYEAFCKMRWPDTNGSPTCPRCNSGSPYTLKIPRKFMCRSCRYQFTVTTGTLFASHKISFATLLEAYSMATSRKEGIGSTTMSRKLGMTGKSAYVLAAKIREALIAGKNPMQCTSSQQFKGYWQR